MANRKVYLVTGLSLLNGIWMTTNTDVYSSRFLALQRIKNSLEINKAKNESKEEHFSGEGYTIYYEALSTEKKYFETAIGFEVKELKTY